MENKDIIEIGRNKILNDMESFFSNKKLMSLHSNYLFTDTEKIEIIKNEKYLKELDFYIPNIPKYKLNISISENNEDTVDITLKMIQEGTIKIHEDIRLIIIVDNNSYTVTSKNTKLQFRQNTFENEEISAIAIFEFFIKYLNKI